MTLEREDIGAAPTDPLLVAMHQLAESYGEARDDRAIFSALAERLGKADAFTAGRTAREWLRHLDTETQAALTAQGLRTPDLETFWRQREVMLPLAPDDGGMLRAFRNDPIRDKLPTASGKIEVFSETIAGFGYSDCPGHPAWLPPVDVPSKRHPLRLIANQPATRHSQLDFGGHSSARKHRGREVVRIHPADATRRRIGDRACGSLRVLMPALLRFGLKPRCSPCDKSEGRVEARAQGRALSTMTRPKWLVTTPCTTASPSPVHTPDGLTATSTR